MFPFDLEDNEMLVDVEEKEPRDYEIDFSTGKLTGRIITGLEAVIQAFKIILLTDRYIFPQYSWTHGSDLYTLIGKNYDEEYVTTEIKRMIQEAISEVEEITGFDNLVIDYQKDRLCLSFSIDTIYGRGEINV